MRPSLPAPPCFLVLLRAPISSRRISPRCLDAAVGAVRILIAPRSSRRRQVRSPTGCADGKPVGSAHLEDELHRERGEKPAACESDSPLSILRKDRQANASTIDPVIDYKGQQTLVDLARDPSRHQLPRRRVLVWDPFRPTLVLTPLARRPGRNDNIAGRAAMKGRTFEMLDTSAARSFLTPLRGVVQDKAPLAGPPDRAFVVERREHGGRCVMPRRAGSRRPRHRRRRQHGVASAAHHP